LLVFCVTIAIFYIVLEIKRHIGRKLWFFDSSYKQPLGEHGWNSFIVLFHKRARDLCIARKSWPDLGNSLALVLQRDIWVSLCSACPRLVWVRCLFYLFGLEVFGGKWQRGKISKIFSDTFRQDSDSGVAAKLGENRLLGNCRKVIAYCGQKTPAVRDLSKSPFCSHFTTNHAQHFLKVVLFDLCTCTIFGPDRLRFSRVIPKRLIFRTLHAYS